MANINKLVQLMQQQVKAYQKQIKAFVNHVVPPSNALTSSLVSFPNFTALSPTMELMKHNQAWFDDYARANSIPYSKVAQVF